MDEQKNALGKAQSASCVVGHYKNASSPDAPALQANPVKEVRNG